MITFPLLGKAGRLGNQLWQIASTIGIAINQGDTFVLPRWVYEPFFNVPPHWFSDHPHGVEAHRYATHIDERARVYMQDYNLWRAAREYIHTSFQPSPVAREIIAKDHLDYLELPRPILVMHVRRGDNATADMRGEGGHHPLRPVSYYRDALAMQSYESLAIFSDDIPWCQAEFADLDAFYFIGGRPRPKEHEPEYETFPVEDWIDLLAMTYGDAFIISNSTYSWWGAFLSKAAGDKIIYPSPWFGEKLNYIDASLMFPKDWTKLEHAT